MISSSVWKNPRITDREVLSAAQNRASSDEIRLICANRDAVKNYQIRHALVSHPKTPLQTAIRFMKGRFDKVISGTSQSRSRFLFALVNQAKVSQKGVTIDSALASREATRLEKLNGSRWCRLW